MRDFTLLTCVEGDDISKISVFGGHPDDVWYKIYKLENGNYISTLWVRDNWIDLGTEFFVDKITPEFEKFEDAKDFVMEKWIRREDMPL